MKINRYRAAGGVVVYADQVLVLHRPSRDEIRLPKGHIEPGELPEATAIRETQEESGYIHLSLLGDLGTQIVEFDFRGEHVIRTEYYFLMTLHTPPSEFTPAPEAQFNPMWLPWEDALGGLSFEAEKEWVRRARTRWNDHQD